MKKITPALLALSVGLLATACSTNPVIYQGYNIDDTGPAPRSGR
ncbi:hypothetical protein Rhal01_02636 [Rubritalea halochordaticola]|uniref:Lipoprotein n=1 Tax=Rubritalea halochordaticola TaxID=714537 RepID=A0ABP9V1B9_9BACT